MRKKNYKDYVDQIIEIVPVLQQMTRKEAETVIRISIVNGLMTVRDHFTYNPGSNISFNKRWHFYIGAKFLPDAVKVQNKFKKGELYSLDFDIDETRLPAGECPIEQEWQNDRKAKKIQDHKYTDIIREKRKKYFDQQSKSASIQKNNAKADAASEDEVYDDEE